MKINERESKEKRNEWRKDGKDSERKLIRKKRKKLMAREHRKNRTESKR